MFHQSLQQMQNKGLVALISQNAMFANNTVATLLSKFNVLVNTAKKKKKNVHYDEVTTVYTLRFSPCFYFLENYFDIKSHS